MTGQADHGVAPGYFTPVSGATYIQLTTFRRDGRPFGPPIPAEAHLLEGEASQRAARLLAAKYPLLHGRLIPWYHRRRGWATQQYRLDRPAAAE
jgi:hypothetical protein